MECGEFDERLGAVCEGVNKNFWEFDDDGVESCVGEWAYGLIGICNGWCGSRLRSWMLVSSEPAVDGGGDGIGGCGGGCRGWSVAYGWWAARGNSPLPRCGPPSSQRCVRWWCADCLCASIEAEYRALLVGDELWGTVDAAAVCSMRDVEAVGCKGLMGEPG